MARVIDYWIDYCNTGDCHITDTITDKDGNQREIRKCGYPQIKVAKINTIQIDNNILNKHKVKKYIIEIHAKDAFHIQYPDNSYFYCTIWVNDLLFCTFKTLCTGNVQVLNYEFTPTQDFFPLLDKENTIIKCELKINNDIVCPRALSILACYDD